MNHDEELQERISELREVSRHGDPAVFDPLYRKLEEATGENEQVAAMLAINIANTYVIEKMYEELQSKNDSDSSQDGRSE